MSTHLPGSATTKRLQSTLNEGAPYDQIPTNSHSSSFSKTLVAAADLQCLAGLLGSPSSVLLSLLAASLLCSSRRSFVRLNTPVVRPLSAKSRRTAIASPMVGFSANRSLSQPVSCKDRKSILWRKKSRALIRPSYIWSNAFLPNLRLLIVVWFYL